MVYVITDCCGAVKIGHTQCMRLRLSSLQTAAYKDLIVLMTIETGEKSSDRKLERILHTVFRNERIILESGLTTEWFKDSIFEKISSEGFLNQLFDEYGFKRKPVVHLGLPNNIYGDIVREKTRMLSNMNLYGETDDEKIKSLKKSEKAHVFKFQSMTLQT